MLLGGGYYGQRLNKIYRGMHFACIALYAFLSITLFRIRDGA